MRDASLTDYPGFFIRVIATSALFLVQDISLVGLGYYLTSPYHTATYVSIVLLSLVLCVMSSGSFKLALLAIICLCQFIWVGSIMYFGDVLRPEQLILAGPEFADTVLGISSALGLLAPAALLQLAVFLCLSRLHRRDPPHSPQAWRVLVGVIVIVTCLLPVRWVRQLPPIRLAPDGSPFVLPASLRNASALALPQTVLASIPLVIKPPVLPPMMRNIRQTYRSSSGEPGTVVLVIGESINPLHVSPFNPGRNSTPNLLRMVSAPPPGFQAIARIGFSGGVATLSSVPLFLKPKFTGSTFDASDQSLFSMATGGGFKSWYFSTQSGRYLSIAGGAQKAETVVCGETWKKGRNARRRSPNRRDQGVSH